MKGRPFVIKPANHYGVPVGKGLFAAIPFYRGQFLLQFTGKIIRKYDVKDADERKRREDYGLETLWGGFKGIVYPRKDGRMSTVHTAGYINEPSLPNLKEGDVFRVGKLLKRNAEIIEEYNPASKNVLVEYEDRSRERVSLHRLAAHALRTEESKIDKSIANVEWQDWPVPLLGLYVPTRKRGDEYVQTLAPAMPGFAEVDLMREKVPDMYLEYLETSSNNVHVMTDGVKLVRGMLMFLKHDKRNFDGLERLGMITEVTPRRVRVRHTLRPNMLWVLPHEILTFKDRKCKDCRKKDDAKCIHCSYVPFPGIWACKDIERGAELLSLYTERGEMAEDRGVGCASPVSADDMRPPWYVV